MNQTLPLTLHFDKAGKRSIQVAVRKPDAESGGAQHGHRAPMVPAAFILALALILGPEAFAHDPAKPAAAPTVAATATPEFELTDHAGRTRRLADFRGKVVTVVFGYTHCPDYCPSTLLRLSQALKELEADAAQVQVLFITVDPARDTPAMLGKYVPAFNPSFIGLSGEAAVVLRAARSFGVSFARVKGPSPETYTVDHTTGIFFLDRGGRLRNVDQEDIPPARIAAELRRLIKAK